MARGALGPSERSARRLAFQALPAKLTDAQAQQALAPVLQQMSDLAAKLTKAQAQQARAPVPQRIGKTTDPAGLLALAEAIQALAAKLSELQAQQALAPVLQEIRKTTDPDALQAFAQALQALAAKLTEAQAQEAQTVSKSSLAWAATEKEAADWARALVESLSLRSSIPPPRDPRPRSCSTLFA